MSGTGTSAPLPAAIYARISKDRDGTGLGVERQEADCRALAERLGWNVVGVYVDNDISAYSGKPRPQYAAMLRAVEAGQVRALLAWNPDRLHRRATELERFISVVEKHGTAIQTVTAGNYDLTTPDGRMVARMLGAAAQREVEATKSRIKRAKEQAAEQGIYRGGRRPYGFKKDGMTVIEKEANVIREATTAVLAGRSLLSIARELNERGVKTSTGRPMDHISLRDVLVRPRNAALISKGKPGREGFEILGPAAWQAIVSEDEFRAVYAILCAPNRRGSNNVEPKWLGSSTYLCGADGCSGTMRAAGRTEEKRKDGTRRRRQMYRCREQNHVTVTAVPTDEYVKQTVAEMLRDPRLVRALTTHEGDTLGADRERRRVLTISMEQTERDYDDDLIDARRYKSKVDKINAEIAEIDTRLALGMQKAATNPVLLAPDPAAAFLNAPVDVQRAVLRETLRVEILPATEIGKAWSPSRLRITPAVA